MSAKCSYPFIKVPTVLFKLKLTASEYVLLCYFLMFSKRIYPSRKTICEQTGLSRHSVDGALKTLRERHLIKWRRGKKNTSNEYAVNIKLITKLSSEMPRASRSDDAEADNFEFSENVSLDTVLRKKKPAPAPTEAPPPSGADPVAQAAEAPPKKKMSIFNDDEDLTFQAKSEEKSC